MLIDESMADILAENKAMTVGMTTRNGNPSLDVVAYGCDERMNLLWISHADSRLSAAVAENPIANFAVFDCARAGRPHIGVEGSGFVVELSGVELSRSTVDFYSWRYPDGEVRASLTGRPSEFAAGSQRRMYRLTPSAMFAVRSGTKAEDVDLEQVECGRVAAAFRTKFRQLFGLGPEYR